MPSIIDFNYLSITGDCTNTNSGAIEFEITGGSVGYTVIWNYPSFGTFPIPSPPYIFNYTSLSGGTYTLTIQDTLGNERVLTFYISTGTCVSILETQNTTCSLDNGSLTAYTENLNGVASFYLYENTLGYITSGQNFSQDFTFTNLTAGTYYVIANDGGGCTGQSESCIVKTSTTFNYDLYVVNDAGCASTGAGAIYVTNQNGNPPYTYLWFNGETTSYITGLTSGTYGVTVTDSSGCVKISNATIVEVDPVGLAGFVVNSPSCFSTDGEVLVTITGGTGPYYYAGSNGETVITFSQNHLFTNVPAGLFTVTVTDAGLCTFTSQTIVQTPGGFSLANISTVNSTCSATNGSVSVELFSVSQPFQFTIIDSSLNIVSSQTLIPGSCGSPPTKVCWSYVGLPSDTYTLNISGGNCSYSTTFTITNVAFLEIISAYKQSKCGRCDGSITLEVSGGTGPYDYILSSPTYFSSVTLAASSYTFTNLCSDTYVGSVGEGRCVVSTNILIPQSQGVNFNLYPTQPTAYLNNGSITSFITSGIPPYTLNWSSNVNGQTGITVNNLSAGTYTLTVIDGNGCVKTKTKTLTGLAQIVDYQIYNVCDTDFTNNGLLLTKGIKQMLNEGYYDLTSEETNCILNQAVFTAIVQVGEAIKNITFYTGTTLLDYPTDQEFADVVKNLLFSFNGITGVTINIDNNDVKISTPCNTLSGDNVKVDLLITYDVSCAGEPPPCSCPSGYILLPDGITCEQVLQTQVILPPSGNTVGLNYEDYPDSSSGKKGLLVYENISTKGWPIFGLPNVQLGVPPYLPSSNNADPNSLSIIPNSGYTNQGVLYTSLSPNSTPGSPHTSLDYPSGYWPVSPWPQPDSPPNIPNLNSVASYYNLSYLSESIVSSGVLQLGSGSSVNLQYNRTGPGLLWAGVPGFKWTDQVGVWSDAPSPYNTLSQYIISFSWIGFSTCVDITEEKEYYILCTANNSLRLKINNLLAVELNNGDGAKQAYDFVNCFPITLSAGTNILSLESGNYSSGGYLGFELLDVPNINYILTASTYSDLEPYVITSTRQKRPRAFDINFTNGSTTVTSSGNFLPSDVGGILQFPSFVLSGSLITQVIDSNTAIISSGATTTGLGLAGVQNGPSTGRLIFLFDTGQRFIDGLNIGFDCSNGYTYVNCGGPKCIQINRVSCS